jgi:hypothetical protein
MPAATEPSYPLPTVHLNGTGRKDLCDGYMAAYKAARRAFDALADATCNARDYYTQGEDAYRLARDERDRQLKNLRDLIRYTEAHVAHLLPE